MTQRLADEVMSPLRQRHRVAEWPGDGPVPRGRLREAMPDVQGLLCMLTDQIDKELLDAAPHLDVISQMAVGVDNIDVAECERRGIALGHTPGVLTETVADTAFALLAAIVRRLPEGEKVVREGRWGPWTPSFMNGRDLHGTSLGIVGMGRIGRALVRRAKGFDMEIAYSSPRAATDVEGEHLSLPDVLVRSDHVVLCVPLTPSTTGLIGEEELRLLGGSSYLVNISRGPVVDTDALVSALEAGLIAGAALDVTDPEPLPPDHPLLRRPNCLVVPHIASSSLRTRRAMATLAVANLVAGLEHRSMPARYRSGA